MEMQPNESESYSDSVDYGKRQRRRAVHSKLRNLFSCFLPSAASRQSTNVVGGNDDNNNNNNDEDDYDDFENAEVYHFDHGSPSYFRTTDCPPHLISEMIAQRATHHATKFWAELFGSINICVTFFVTFLLQFYR